MKKEIRMIGRVLVVLLPFAVSSPNTAADELEMLTKEIQILSKKIEKIKKQQELESLKKPSPPPNEISITSAVYGTTLGSCDATAFVKLACSGKQYCNLDISDQICGDPTPKPKNSIKIEYNCSGMKKAFSGEEGLKATLFCP